MTSADPDAGRSEPERPRRVVVLAFEGVEPLDVVGPADIFASVNFRLDGSIARRRPYEVVLAAPSAGPLRSFTGLQLVAEQALDRLDPDDIDTLVVAGGPGTWDAVENDALIAWLAKAHGRVRRLCSVCTGAFLLAAAGVLDGRRATTHWRWCETLAARYPTVTVAPDSIWVRDGDVYTSAGVTAGMDLALALVEQDLGRRAAMLLARAKVMFMKRPGGQSQFSEQLRAQSATSPQIGDLQQWILGHLGDDLTVPALADRVAMSPRHFTRLFQRETRQTPARFVAAARMAAARQRLEDGADGIERIAFDCGFGNAERMRRTFLRHLGVSPNDYRQRFRADPPQPTEELS